MNTLSSSLYFPRAAVSARVLVWSALVGVALVLPLGYLLHLLAPAGWTAPADYRHLMASRLHTTPWLLALRETLKRIVAPI